MKHDYVGYSIPAPSIHEPDTVVEDVAGSLTTTHTLLNGLLGDIEGLQDIALRQRTEPGSIDPQAWMGRIENLWALGEAISARVKNDAVLLYALVEHQQHSGA